MKLDICIRRCNSSHKKNRCINQIRCEKISNNFFFSKKSFSVTFLHTKTGSNTFIFSNGLSSVPHDYASRSSFFPGALKAVGKCVNMEICKCVNAYARERGFTSMQFGERFWLD